MVDGHLAADAAVMGKDGRRKLNEADPPHIRGSHIPGQISDNTAAKRQNSRAAVQPGLNGRCNYFFIYRQ